MNTSAIVYAVLAVVALLLYLMRRRSRLKKDQ